MNVNYIDNLYLEIPKLKKTYHVIGCNVTFSLGYEYPKADLRMPYSVKDDMFKYKEDEYLCRVCLLCGQYRIKKYILLEGFITDIALYQTAKEANLIVSVLHKYVKYLWKPIFAANTLPGNLVLSATPPAIDWPTVSTPKEFLTEILNYITNDDVLNAFDEVLQTSPIARYAQEYYDTIVGWRKKFNKLIKIPDIKFMYTLDPAARSYFSSYLHFKFNDIFQDMARMSLFELLYKYIKLLNLELQFTPTSAQVISNVPFVTKKNKYDIILHLDTINITIKQQPWAPYVYLLARYLDKKSKKLQIVPVASCAKKTAPQEDSIVLHLYVPEVLYHTFIYPIPTKAVNNVVFTLIQYNEHYAKHFDVMKPAFEDLAAGILGSEVRYQYMKYNLGKYSAVVTAPFTEKILLPGSYAIFIDLDSKIYAMISRTEIHIDKKAGTAHISYSLSGVIPDYEFEDKYFDSKYFAIDGHPWYDNSEEKNFYVIKNEA